MHNCPPVTSKLFGRATKNQNSSFFSKIVDEYDYYCQDLATKEEVSTVSGMSASLKKFNCQKNLNTKKFKETAKASDGFTDKHDETRLQCVH